MRKTPDSTRSGEDPGSSICDLFPARFARRNPGLNPIGRLAKKTRGLPLVTDAAKWLHKIIHPKSVRLDH